MKILSYLTPIELCAVAETCTHLNIVARDSFKSQLKSSMESYNLITTDEKFQDHQRILKNFGNLISSVSITDYTVGDSTGKIASAYDWLERYCANTLQTLIIYCFADIMFLPSAAVTLMSKVKYLEINAPNHHDNLRTFLSHCKELVGLVIGGAFHVSSCIWSNRFPHLKKLNCGWINTNEDYNQIESFFQHHSKLTTLTVEFKYPSYGGEDRIDLSFIQNLLELEELTLKMNSSNIEGIDALTKLRNVKEFSISGKDMQTYTAMLNSLASVESLVKASFIMDVYNLRATSGGGGVFQSVKRFKNLSTLEVEAWGFDFSSLQPKQIAEAIRYLPKIQVVDLDCNFESNLDERFYEDLVKVCSSQQRKIIILIDRRKVDDKHRKFFEKFNREHEAFVEIRKKSK